MSKGLPQLVGTEFDAWHHLALGDDERVLHVSVRVMREMLEQVRSLNALVVAQLQTENEILRREVEHLESFDA